MKKQLLPTTYTFIHNCMEQAIPVFTLQPQSVAALWLVLICRPTEGRRLS